MSREHDTACDNGHWSLPHSSLVMGDLPRLLYPLTFFSLRQVGGREPSSQDVTLPLIPDEDREINQHLYAVWKDFVGSQSQGHSADDIKLVTEKNGRPSMYVYHTIVMVRTLSLCWQVLLQAILRHHQDNYHLANRDWLHDIMTLPGCSIIIIDLFSLYPGLHMCKQGLPVNTGSLAACWWSRVWAAVGTVASRVTAGCWDCVILWWFVWCGDTITVNKDFFIRIWLWTFRFINVCIREIPCFKWNYNVNLDVVHESGTKTQIPYFPCNSSKTFMFSIFNRLNETWRFQKYFEFFIFMKKVDPSSKKL